MNRSSSSAFFSKLWLLAILMAPAAFAEGLKTTQEQYLGKIESDHSLFQNRAIPLNAILWGQGEDQKLLGIRYQDKKVSLRPSRETTLLGEGVIPMSVDLYAIEIVQGWPVEPASDRRYPEMDSKSFKYQAKSSAKFTLTYLKDAEVYGSATYQHIPLELRRKDNGHWGLFDQQGKEASVFFAQKKSGAFGFEKVELRKPEQSSEGCSPSQTP